MGLRKIQEQLEKEAKLREEGATLAINELNSIITGIKALQKQVEKLEKKYGNDFKTNPEAAKRLMKIRQELGLPEHLGVFSAREGPSITDKLTGGGFYEQVALQILQMEKEIRSKTGGLMTVAEIIFQLNKRYEGLVITPTDVIKGLESLNKNNLIADIRKTESGTRYVEFIDLHLSEDHKTVLELAARYAGELPIDVVLRDTGWNVQRAEAVLKAMEQKKLTEKKKDLDGTRFLFYGF
ncbi:MAG: hypothetical protein ACXAEU_04010 [Candidatus Hodarchaeales archaeon]